MTPRTYIEAALEAGLPVFPAGLSKRPLVGGWNAAAPTARREWANEMSWPRMGLACAGRVVVDVDAHELPEALNRCDRQAGALVATKRGFHEHYSLPAGLAARQRIAWKPGIDLKAGAGSYVVIPPSRGYKLLRGSLVRPPLAPDWLIEAVTSEGGSGSSLGEPDPEAWTSICRQTRRWRPMSAGAEKVIEDTLARVRQAEPGAQNGTLNREAFTLGKNIGRYRIESVASAELALLPAACKMVPGNPGEPWTWANARPIVRRALIAGFHQGQGERSPKE